MSIVFLAIAVGVGYLGYREAAKHQAQYGTAPWGVAPPLWGLIVGVTGIVLGGILLWAACRADKAKAAATPMPAEGPAPAPVPVPKNGRRKGGVRPAAYGRSVL